jgi:hypothetical protein
LISVLALGSLVAVGGVVVPGRAWAGSALAGTTAVTVDAPDAPNLAGQGQLALTILGTGEIDATRIDPETVVLHGNRTGIGGGVRVARTVDGQPLAMVTDANSDGRADLGVLFDKQAMREAGVLTAGTTTLALSGRLPDGRSWRTRAATRTLAETRRRSTTPRLPSRSARGPTAAASSTR